MEAARRPHSGSGLVSVRRAVAIGVQRGVTEVDGPEEPGAVPPGWAAVKTGRHVRPASGEVAVDDTGPVGQVDQVVAQTNSALAVPWTV